MADIVSPRQRSKNMAAIHSANTRPELYFRKLLFARGLRYRIHTRTVSGCPDIYLRKYNTAIFVNGCFWHRHSGCKFSYTPKSRVDFWEKKFSDNMKRDSHVKKDLAAAGIRQIIIWECTVKKMQKDECFRDTILETVIQFLTSDSQFLEL